MRKLTTFLTVLCILLLPLLGLDRETFLVTPVDVNAGQTVDTSSNSAKVYLSKGLMSTYAKVQVTFTRSAGSESTVDFRFQYSLDDGITWDTDNTFEIKVATNTAASSNVVRKTESIDIYGATRIRLSSIKNNDGANNVTACNATISF